MPREEWYIHYHSNIRREATKDAAAMRGLHKAERDVTANKIITAKQLRDEYKKKVKGRSITSRLTRKINNWSKALQKNNLIQKALAKSSHTAGINIGALSLRINEGLVPVLLLAYSAILPVVAGLLAIASAAVVAGAGIVGVLGLGVAALSTKRGAPPVWGARNVTEDKGVFAELLEPLKDALKSRELKSSIRVVTELTEDFFGDTLPKSFKAFISALDMKAISNMFKAFQNFLPGASKSVAELGNEIYNAIGDRSLRSINKLFKYIAAGLKNTAEWLAETGFDDIESFGSILSAFISKLLDLGKSVLPTLTKSLENVYPIPLEPMIESLTNFFNSIRDTDTQRGIAALASIAVSMVAISTVISVIGGVISALKGLSFIWKGLSLIGFALGVAEGATAIAGLAGSLFVLGIAIGTVALLKLAEEYDIVRKILTNLGVFIINVFIYVVNTLTNPLRYLANIVGWITGNETLKNYDPRLQYWRYSLKEDNIDEAGNIITQNQQNTQVMPVEITLHNETTLDSDVLDRNVTKTLLEPVIPINRGGRFPGMGSI